LEVEPMRDEMSLSEVEPELGAIDAYALAPEEPPFPLVIRGYDRHAVDDYLEAASARIAELEALQSPSEAVRQALERVANDTGSILKEAHETADGVVARAREEASRTVRDARAEAGGLIAGAEAKMRHIAIDTDALWQERMRLIEDARAVSTSLAEIADEATARFPADEPEPERDASGVVVADALDEVLLQPTEALDVAAIWAAEDEAQAACEAEAVVELEDEAVIEEPAGDERPLPEGLDDLEPPPEFR
jgi:cell division septum initiation protein DivIVA